MTTSCDVLHEIVKNPRELSKEQRERVEKVLIPAIMRASREVTESTVDNVIWRVGEILGVNPRDFINHGS